MALTATRFLTEADISAQFGYPTPYTYQLADGVALAALNLTTAEGWTFTGLSQVGTDLQATLSVTADPSVVPGPGVESTPFGAVIIELEDGNGDTHYVQWLPTVVPEFAGPAATPPTVNNDGPLSFVEDQAFTIDLGANDVAGTNPIDWSTLVFDPGGVLAETPTNNGDGTITFPAGVATPGTYAPTYTVSDTAGNPATPASATVDLTITVDNSPVNLFADLDISCWDLDNGGGGVSTNAIAGGVLDFTAAELFDDISIIPNTTCLIPVPVGATTVDFSIEVTATDGGRLRAGVRFFDSSVAIVNGSGGTTTFLYDENPSTTGVKDTVALGTTETIPAGAVWMRFNVQSVGLVDGDLTNLFVTFN